MRLESPIHECCEHKRINGFPNEFFDPLTVFEPSCTAVEVLMKNQKTMTLAKFAEYFEGLLLNQNSHLWNGIGEGSSEFQACRQFAQNSPF